MARPRSRDKAIPITIAIPTSLAMKLENDLSHSQSRSKWICGAIEDKMLGIKTSQISETSTRQLIAALTQREDVDETLKLLLFNVLKS
tara:strand:- start:239 stop:502 length:264 start_codon:yes stop_codon:yes gene_type:complete